MFGFSKKKEENTEIHKKKKRSFIGARHSRFTNWINTTLTRVNGDINNDLIDTITKCRDLAKNNPIVRAYLSSCVKNVIGRAGFTLQCQLKNFDNSLNESVNDEVEWEFYEFGKASNGQLTVDGGMGHNEFDALILRTLLIDGEVFIRIHKNRSSKYGVQFEIIDSASIDYTKKREASTSNNAIILGVEVDAYYKPVAYYVRPR